MKPDEGLPVELVPLGELAGLLRERRLLEEVVGDELAPQLTQNALTSKGQSG